MPKKMTPAQRAQATRERLHLMVARVLEQIEEAQDAVREAQDAGLIGWHEAQYAIVDLDQMWHTQPCIRLTLGGN